MGERFVSFLIKRVETVLDNINDAGSHEQINDYVDAAHDYLAELKSVLGDLIGG